MSEQFAHPQLGKINGKSNKGSIQFFGIKYATTKSRFAAAELYEASGDGVIDATKFGPSVAVLPQGVDMEASFIQHTLTATKVPMSETDGLNLNITIPKLPSGSTKKLPVYVFVHGGGFFIGGNSYPTYDATKIIELSVEMGMPIIGVGINYRLGAAGFLTSEDLRSQGFPTNNGLRDQQVAFNWVKKYISGFGGDPDNITAIGNSAGSVSVTLQLYSETPLFNRAFCSAGTSLLIRPLPLAVHEATYNNVLKALDIKGETAKERVDALLKVPIDDIIFKVPPGQPYIPALDGEMLTFTPEHKTFSTKEGFSRLPGAKWCKGLIIGECALDGTILCGQWGPRPNGLAASFTDCVIKTLSEYPTEAKEILKAYGITPEISDDDATLRIVEFGSDIGFIGGGISFARGFPGPVYRYYYNEPNPWDGQWKSKASHIMDIKALFLNYNDRLPSGQAQTSTEMAKDLITFMNGKAPWKAYERQNPVVKMYGPSAEEGFTAEIQETDDEKVKRRRNILLQFETSPGWDALSATWGAFLQGQ
ncbi:carboxylesterase-like protein [Xylogone sp. PMI_703]|nr:carboxylesterase-like protein [Xylogone sp. PMI_703]